MTVHFHISKSDKNGISSTNILKLDKAAKINIIATMISGEATPTAMQQAEDMINREQYIMETIKGLFHDILGIGSSSCYFFSRYCRKI